MDDSPEMIAARRAELIDAVGAYWGRSTEGQLGRPYGHRRPVPGRRWTPGGRQAVEDSADVVEARARVLAEQADGKWESDRHGVPVGASLLIELAPLAAGGWQMTDFRDPRRTWRVRDLREVGHVLVPAARELLRRLG